MTEEVQRGALGRQNRASASLNASDHIPFRHTRSVNHSELNIDVGINEREGQFGGLGSSEHARGPRHDFDSGLGVRCDYRAAGNIPGLAEVFDQCTTNDAFYEERRNGQAGTPAVGSTVTGSSTTTGGGAFLEKPLPVVFSPTMRCTEFRARTAVSSGMFTSWRIN